MGSGGPIRVNTDLDILKLMLCKKFSCNEISDTLNMKPVMISP